MGTAAAIAIKARSYEILNMLRGEMLYSPLGEVVHSSR